MASIGKHPINTEIFLENKYSKWYYSIITAATNQKRSKGFEYYEHHHIIPRSLGGTNSPENLVFLTAKEHYVCHCLLIKMVLGEDKRKMVFAVHKMQFSNSSGQHRYRSSVYEYYRKMHSLSVSAVHKNKVTSDETKRKISIAKTGQKLGSQSATTKRKKSEALKGRKFPNRFDSAETTKKRSLAQHKNWITRKQNQVILLCPHCQKSGTSKGNMNRFHFDNCRIGEVYE